MTRLSYRGMLPTAHTTGIEICIVVESFITALMESQSNIEWFGSRTSDCLKIQGVFMGLHIELIHMVPKDHVDYKFSNSFSSGDREEEVVVKVIDMSQRWGRVNVVDERFNENSQLFNQSIELFNHLWRKATFFGSVTAKDRLSYVHTVRNVSKLLEEK